MLWEQTIVQCIVESAENPITLLVVSYMVCRSRKLKHEKVCHVPRVVNNSPNILINVTAVYRNVNLYFPETEAAL